MEEFYAGRMDHGVAAVVVPGFGDEDRAGGGGIDENNLVLDDDGPMSFYATEFPPLPDFPCMSSSSSSSSTQAPVKGTSSSSSASSSSSSAASWAVLRSDQDVDRSPDPMAQQPVQVPHQPCAAATAPAPLATALSSTGSMDMMTLTENVKMEDVRCEEGEEDVGLEDCLDVMETFGYMDLLECNDLFDPASIFQSEEPGADLTVVADNNGAYPIEEFDQVQLQLPVEEQPVQNFQQPEAHGHPASAVQTYEQQQQLPMDKADAADDMGQLLLEWLRTNRDSISAEDLRRIKIKKATIESAAQRLGGGKTAMRQLLKLILDWVQTNHLNRKRKEAESQTKLGHYSPFQDAPDPGAFPNPNPNVLNPSNANSAFSPEPASCFPGQPQWGSPYMTEHAGSVMPAPPSFVPSNVGYMGGDLFTGSGDLYPGPQGMADYHMLESPHSWSMPHFAPASQYNYMTADPNFQQQQTFVGYGNNPQYTNFPQQYYNTGNGERSLMRLGSSATKEARKKRMARQRRLMSHHHHHRGGSGHHTNHHASHHNGHHQAVMAMDHQQHARLGGCDQAAAANSGNWVYWPAQAPALAAPPPPSILPPDQAMQQVHQPVERQPAAAAQGQSGQRGQVAPDRRQGWKSENNLKFLLQKVLKQSDVGNLGRIVLPKKEAETHLPELEARDGISISMEDIGTSRVWNMRYRFWPNNKSRMYLLENTGDFVRANGLQEGDFIVIYSDVKCGKYLIRGVKVRQTEGGGVKSDPKRPENSKPQRNSSLQGSSTSTGAGHATKSK